MSWSDWALGELDALRIAGRHRSNRVFDAKGPVGVLGGRPVVSFASNDYLGLSSHPAVASAAKEAIDRWGTGATASRLIVGTRPVHCDLEAAIAEWKHCEAAIVFSTGFAANLGVLGVVGGPGTTVFSDALNHASIIDGCRLSRSVLEVYRHRDLAQLQSLLTVSDGRKVVVTDAVFSMDGDVAQLDSLQQLCAGHDALLVIDEAHSVLGPELSESSTAEVLRVGTLSKTLGSLGGWAAGPQPLIDLMVNRARSLIFTTGLSPADAAAASAALAIVRSGEGELLRSRLRDNIDRIVPGHPSPIIPVFIGGDAQAVVVSAALLESGVLVPAIRPPTVPEGTSRLRIAVSSAHSATMIDALLAALGAAGLTDASGMLDLGRVRIS